MTGELVFAHVGFGDTAVPYEDGWELQRALHERRVAGEIPDVCLLLEHRPVYTAGKRTEPSDRPVGDAGAPVIDVDRGGRITWHGPGQLVGYPVVKLAEPLDVVAYVRSIEQALIDVCAGAGVPAERVDGRSGAWVRGPEPSSPAAPSPGLTLAGPLFDTPAGAAPRERKVGAIGVRVSRGVTMHGFALNCDCDLAWFGRIVPCGISDAGVTTLTAETGHRVTVASVLPAVERAVAAALGATGWRRDDALAVAMAGSSRAGS